MFFLWFQYRSKVIIEVVSNIIRIGYGIITTVMPTDPHQGRVTRMLKSTPSVKAGFFSPTFLPYKQAAAKYNKQHSLKW